MNYKMYHVNLGAMDIERSKEFYEEALGLTETKRVEAEDGSFVIVFLSRDGFAGNIELTWYRDKKEPYNLGDNEVHIGLYADDYEAAYQKHKEMGVICFENLEMGLYFISDPDGYWIEIVPAGR